MKHVTLLFLLRDNQVLLAMKKRGFGMGKWNGVGGKADPGESPLRAALRECHEEIGVTPTNAMRVGQLRFLMPDDPEFENFCHVFVATRWQGQPVETDEMQPQWFDLAAVPFDDMWPDDVLWLLRITRGELVQGTVVASEQQLVSHNLEFLTAPKEVPHAAAKQ